MRTRSMVFVLLLSLAASPLVAADEATDAERLYLDTRHSDDHLTQLLGERWYGLVKLQEWTDATGKFHAEAKYIEHDPDMKWVKLLAVKEGPDGRISKELTIPVEKLDKRCQSRVRQIDHLRSKVEAAIAASTESAEKAEGEPPGTERSDAEFGTPEDRAPDRMEREARPANPHMPKRESPPDDAALVKPDLDRPVAFPATPLETSHEASTPPAAEAAAVASEPPPSTPQQTAAEARSQEPRLLDSEPWRTDYDVFRAKFTADRSGFAQMQAEQGPLLVLSELFAKYQQDAASRDPRSASAEDSALEQQLYEEVGEFVWEAELAEAVGSQNDWSKLLRLPPLPVPVTLTLQLDAQMDQGHWQAFQKGSRVRFIGHFTGFTNQHGLVAAIRFPEIQPAQATKPEVAQPKPASPR